MSIASVMLSSHIILWCPFLLLPSIFPSVREFSSKSAVHIRWPKYWSFSFSISLSNEYSGLISLKIDWFDLLNYPRDSQESSPAPHSIAAAAAAKSLQSCPTLCDPIDRQPIRLPHPWDSPGKNTGVGGRFLLQCMKVKSEREVAQLCPTLSGPMDYSPPGSSVRGSFQARVLEWVAIAFSGNSS